MTLRAISRRALHGARRGYCSSPHHTYWEPNPRGLSYMASYAVVSNNCQALPSHLQRGRRRRRGGGEGQVPTIGGPGSHYTVVICPPSAGHVSIIGGSGVTCWGVPFPSKGGQVPSYMGQDSGGGGGGAGAAAVAVEIEVGRTEAVEQGGWCACKVGRANQSDDWHTSKRDALPCVYGGPCESQNEKHSWQMCSAVPLGR